MEDSKDTSHAPVSAWDQLPTWIREPLEAAPFRFDTFLPVQEHVIPVLNRAISSHLHSDVSLTAPTGSGKTLCYLIPMLTLIAKEKRELSDCRLRGVVLVPTKALGAQVYAVAKKICSGTNISVVCACGEHPTKEAHELVRRCHVSSTSLFVRHDEAAFGDEGEDTMQSHREVDDDEDVDALLTVAERSIATRGTITHGEETEATSMLTKTFDGADLLIATPQRLLKHLGSTSGFQLRSMRMLVIDEADQILSNSGTFTHLVGRILRLCEQHVGDNTSDTNSQTQRVLHKMLCSATLSTHVTRTAEVRLRNCRYFSLDTEGRTVETVRIDAALRVPDDGASKTQQLSTSALGLDALHLTNTFALPPKLQEHMLLVLDEQRPALLRKLLKHILQGPSSEPNSSSGGVKNDDGEDGDSAQPSEIPPSSTAVTSTVGKTCIVFCAQSDTARVLAKYLQRCDIAALDFTSTSSLAERRRFVMSGVSGKSVALVTTDTLMRGVDLPMVGHVVMYDAPSSVAQFVHRIGRTARALRDGHAYMLLSKKGPSGSLADGEVARYKSLDAFLTRSLPVIHEKVLQQLTPEDVNEANVKLEETQQALKKYFVTASKPSSSKQQKPSASPVPAAATIKKRSRPADQ